MFAKAYEQAISFTHPVIVSLRFFDKSVESGLGSFVILNAEGWIATVAHLVGTYLSFQQHSKEIAAYNEQLRTIAEAQGLSAKQKRKKIGRLPSNPKWITEHSFWWGADNVQVREFNVLADGDLAVGRLEPFNAEAVSVYPVLKNPANLRIGTSLCRLGFPLHKVEASFSEETKRFELAPGTLPVPRFPIEGIYTRNILAGRSKDGRYEIKFLETSSPGLKGQSGGPIFDVRGTVWAIQSTTQHFPLGFSPKVLRKGQEVEENQFLNVGWGIHPELLVAFLSDNGIKFALSDH